MRRTFFIFCLLFLLFAGCTGTTPTNQPAANNSIPQVQTPQPAVQQPAPKQTYTCPDGTVVTSPSDCQNCPSLCDDNDPCTRDICDQTTAFKCKSEKLDGPQVGCSGDLENCMEKTCTVGVCSTQKQATQPKCKVDADCNDKNNFTNDFCFSIGTCSAICVNSLITECKNGDGPCPYGCGPLLDNDCPTYGVGQFAKINNNTKIRILSKNSRDCITEYTYISDSDFGYYYIVKIELENKGTVQSDYVTASSFTLIDAVGRQYDGTSYLPGASCADIIPLDSGTIYPGVTRTGSVFFELGKTVALSNPVRVIYDPNMYTDNDEVVFQFNWDR
jgi:hypothetical protein